MDISLLVCFVLILAFFLEWFLRQLKFGKFESRYVLITGCDSGFGHDLAKELDKLGLNVFACCLTKAAVEKFNVTSSSNLKAIEMDMSKDVSIEKAMEIVQSTLPEGKGNSLREHYKTGLKVAIVEQGAFKTPIFGRGYIKRMAENKVASLPANIRSELPNDAVDQLEGAIHHLEETGSTNTHIVVDSYVHAITAKFPKKRYLVGNDAKYVYSLLSVLPECISDFYIDWQGAVSI